MMASASSVKKGMRRFSALPVYVVDDHNEVLPFIYRCIGSKHLPMSGIKIIHFDAHPDLLIPAEYPADKVFNKDELFEVLSIENWIMPAVYAGHIDSVDWVKPAWAQQIRETTMKITVGKHRTSGTIKLNNTETYFMSELLYAPNSELLNQKGLNVSVKTLPHILRANNPVAGEPDSSEHQKHGLKRSASGDFITQCDDQFFILDIDLDFFSTVNPFKSIYTEHQYSLLKQIFRFQPPTNSSEKSIQMCLENRQKQLAEIRLFIKEAVLENKTSKTSITGNENISMRRKLVHELISEICAKTSEEIDIDQIMQTGFTCDDDSELPHHISSDEEIHRLILNVSDYLKDLPHKPTIVTIARSSSDEYCPLDQVDQIQSLVFDLLTKHYGELNVTLKYKDD
ncbi:UPF0489 protein C5orf22 homolog [Tubulanus polymorphus]|uniref:UPF0489 protein C5orf22 homolog n=1 Tax=Tubulanus polymorphus TaxID=672921 RepID=UPI003DA49D99